MEKPQSDELLMSVLPGIFTPEDAYEYSYGSMSEYDASFKKLSTSEMYEQYEDFVEGISKKLNYEAPHLTAKVSRMSKLLDAPDWEQNGELMATERIRTIRHPAYGGKVYKDAFIFSMYSLSQYLKDKFELDDEYKRNSNLDHPAASFYKYYFQIAEEAENLVDTIHSEAYQGLREMGPGAVAYARSLSEFANPNMCYAEYVDTGVMHALVVTGNANSGFITRHNTRAEKQLQKMVYGPKITRLIEKVISASGIIKRK